MAGLLLLGACAETELVATVTKELQRDDDAKGVYKVGRPYQIDGVWYHPAEDPYYDETGIASWYGEPFHGRRTANGEIYDMNALTAAHKTLPMPVWVRVTNLQNGRSMVLKVNDRGPFARGRIIDVSRRAAQLLGFENAGTARVRVQVVDPASGTAYASKDPAAPAPEPVRADPVELTSTETDGAIFVQIGAFADADNAQNASSRVSGVGHVQIYRIVSGNQPLYRVRLGPFETSGQANIARDRVAATGYPEARVVVD